MNGDTLRWLKLAKSSKGINSTKAAWMEIKVLVVADLGPLKDFLVKEATKSASITEIRKTVCLFIFQYGWTQYFFQETLLKQTCITKTHINQHL